MIWVTDFFQLQSLLGMTHFNCINLDVTEMKQNSDNILYLSSQSYFSKDIIFLTSIAEDHSMLELEGIR